MCSQADNSQGNNMFSSQFIEHWHASEEEDEEEAVSYPRVRKTKSVPPNVNGDSIKKPPMARAKTERVSRISGYSLTERMKDLQRRRSCVVSREGELLAKQYSKVVRNDTLKHVNNAVRFADSIVQKGANINDELSRQERFLCKVDNEMSTIDYDTDLTARALKGMTSLTGKISSTISKRKSKRKLNKLNFDLMAGESGLCALSRINTTESLYSPTVTESSVCTPEQQIKTGLGQLNNALDVIKVQQLDTAWALQRHEGLLGGFEGKLDTTHEKINHQNTLMKKIMNK